MVGLFRMTEHGIAGGPAAAGLVAEVDGWLRTLVDPAGPRGPAAVERARALVAALDHPHRAAPAVHVVGTAGKGTVAALLTQRCAAAGVSTATHLSPHVHDIRERFQLDGSFPSDGQLAAAFARVRDVVTAMRTGDGPPSFFAATAALSWEIGRSAGVDLFITEAGIGGRHDATIVLDRPDTVSVITAIGIDHADVLGDTVERIAVEKAGVVRGRRVAVLGPQPDRRAGETALRLAADAGVELVEVAPRGDVIADAVATVDAVASVLEREHGLRLPPVDPVLPPGRLDRREIGGRRCMFDGAHNPMKLARLAEALRGDLRPAVALVALGAAKDLVGCARSIAGLGCPVVVTDFETGGGPRSHAPDAVADALAAIGVEAVAAEDLHDAAAAVFRRAGAGEAVLVTGSFLFLHDAEQALARTG